MVLGGLWHGAAWTFVLWGIYHGVLLIVYRAGERLTWFREWVSGGGGVARTTSWLVMFHLTCYGWLIFRSRSASQLRTMTSDLVTAFAPRSVNVEALLVPLLMYTTPVLIVHACEAVYDNVLAVPRLPLAVRYSVYAATFYLTMLFGNFGGAEFIYFQF
jgi:D-alanyl-lipoteichoic acid acyltransferase DltB (MBOAT superfamily)